jgi:hypothetical protein
MPVVQHSVCALQWCFFKADGPRAMPQNACFRYGASNFSGRVAAPVLPPRNVPSGLTVRPAEKKNAPHGGMAGQGGVAFGGGTYWCLAPGERFEGNLKISRAIAPTKPEIGRLMAPHPPTIRPARKVQAVRKACSLSFQPSLSLPPSPFDGRFRLVAWRHTNTRCPRDRAP